MTRLCLLGLSGSIGQQTLDVIKKHPHDFSLVSFSVGNRTRQISYLIKRFSSLKAICIKDKKKAIFYQKKYPNIHFYSDDEGLIKLIDDTPIDMVVNALVGFVGLKPTIHALNKNLKVALANKESLVVGGELINRLLKEGHGLIYPIDSEHSALWKCLKVDNEHIKKMCLTASGGAFRKLNREELVNVTPEMALNHPTWKMGSKITIDCATMVNKCFELIEAYYLYGYPYDKLQVTLHDESRVHSYLVYEDGSIRADISKPDMRNPIKFALYEGDIPFKTYKLKSLDDLKELHFHSFDEKRYPLVTLAKLVIEKQGPYGAILNASNEVAVNAYLKHQIKFLDIENIIYSCLNKVKAIKIETYDDLALLDKETRILATKMVEERKKTL